MLNSRMLTHLSINALTLVDQLELEFSQGMSVVTGETGAGKSILLGALGLALGDRADSSLIAPGKRKTEISACFDLHNHDAALAWLQERDLDDNHECILRRVVSKDGRSRAFINGGAITLSELKTLSEKLLDIHSQHEHQSLLKKETHRKLLDEFGGLGEVVAEVRNKFAHLHQLKTELTNRRQDAEAQSAKVQLLTYQAAELSELAVQTGEPAELEAELKRLSSAEETQNRIQEAITFCDTDDNAASNLLARALACIEGIESNDIVGIRELLQSAAIQLEEASVDLNRIVENFSADPGRQREVEDRLGHIYETARKHKVQPDELPELTLSIVNSLDDILNSEARLESLEQEVKAAEGVFQTIAEKLTTSRQKTAQLLASEVTDALHSLGMAGANFSIFMEPAKTPSANGMDSVEFRIATLPGAEPGSLAKIASGGELSRISLAIQVITAGTSNTPTLVFDEVDVGVGGATAEVVGNLLRKLGTSAQVICVTHLPQVAAQGHHHYVVSKSTTADSATTLVRRLTEEEKVDEIARMLGGIEKTDQSMAHAQAMISGVEG